MNTTPHVIVFGGRDFTDYDLLCRKLDQYTADLGALVVVSGKCPTGADALGERWAADRGWDVLPFKADWNLGKKGGPIRNERMAKFVGGLRNGFAVGVWDGRSRGTADMIEQCQRYGIELKLVRY